MQEIQTPAFGFGFDGILRSRAGDLIGILNGIDYDQWDPCRDPYLPVPCDASHLEGKDAAKRLVLETFGLPADDGRPSSAARGDDLAAGRPESSISWPRSPKKLPSLGASFVLLGTGERRCEICGGRSPSVIRIGSARVSGLTRLLHIASKRARTCS